MINIYSLGENYGIKIIVLFVFWKIIKLHPNVKLLKKRDSNFCLSVTSLFKFYALVSLI